MALVFDFSFNFNFEFEFELVSISGTFNKKWLIFTVHWIRKMFVSFLTIWKKNVFLRSLLAC